jgi:MFS family permease
MLPDPALPALSPLAADSRFDRWEIPAAASLSALFFAALFVVPLVGAVGFPLTAVPLSRVTHRRGLGAGLTATGLSVGILCGVALASAGWREAVGTGLAAAFVAGLPVLLAGRVRSGSDPSRAFLVLGLAGSILLTAALFGLPATGQPPIETELRSTFDTMIPAALESYRRGNADTATVDRVRSTLMGARDFTVRYWAGLIGAGWILGAAVAFYAGARAARPAPSAERVRFETLRVPPGFAALFVAAGAGFALVEGPARTVAGDLLLALAALYFVAGLSIICHFARRWFRAWFLRLGLYILVAYFPMNLGVALLGLFDWYANFRRRGEKEQMKT